MTPVEARLQSWLSDDEGSLRKARFALVMAVIYVAFSASYIASNLFSVGRRAYRLYLPGEARIPFLPIFEYLYVLTFFVPVLLIVTVGTYERFRRLMRALGIALAVAFSTYLLFPVYFERRPLAVSSLHTWLLSLQYLDKPYNDFPSLHVTLSWLAVHASQVSRGSRIALVLVATGISISTVFVKQHYVVDVVFGYVLAWGAWTLAAVARPRAGSSVVAARR